MTVLEHIGGKHSKKSDAVQNRGSAVIEATLVMPLFIFAILAVYHMGQIKLAEAAVYEAAVETAEYMAEYAYMDGNNIFLPELKFEGYVDDKELVDRYVAGGTEGIDFWGTIPLDEENNVVLKGSYIVSLPLPFMPELSYERTFTIRQRAYVGADSCLTEEGGAREEYVYVTDNRDVYHTTRSCTYLMLSIRMTNRGAACDGGYSACELCGERAAEEVYVTDYGGRYHADIRCSGLKRTVYRVKRSELGGLEGCSRCAGQ